MPKSSASLSQAAAALLLLLFLYPACTHRRNAEVKAFYYPIDSLKEGKVYEYRDVLGKGEPYYWLFIGLRDEQGANFLLANRYNADYIAEQFVKERIQPNGAYIEDYRLYLMDSLLQREEQAQIIDDLVYPFSATRDSSLAYFFKLKIKDPKDSTVQYTISRGRRFVSFQTVDVPNFGTRKTANFNIIESIAVEAKDGGNWELKGTGSERYAEGLGLVEEMRLFQGEQRTYRLHAIHPMGFLSEKMTAAQPPPAQSVDTLSR